MPICLPSFAGVAQPASGGTPFTNEYSLSFDGSDDFVTMSNPDDLNFSGDTTISFWVKYTNQASSFNFMIDKSTSTTTRQYALYLRNETGGTKTFSFSTDGGTAVINNSTGTISVNQWSHVAVVVESGVTNGTKLYINGSSETLGTHTITTNDPAPFQLGKRHDTSFLFGGLMDEVAIFNSALSASDISTLRGGASAGTLGLPADISSLSPVGWWRMGDGGTWDGTNWTIPDASTNSNTGTTANMAEASRVTDVPVFNKYAISLDGTDDYLDIPDSTALETTAFTWSAWFYCTAIDRYNIIVDTATNSGTFNGYELFVKNNDNKIRFSSYSSNDVIDSTTVVSVNTWYHVAATHESGSDKLYVNGSLEASGSASSFNVTDAANLRIGSSSIYSYYHQGLIDEVAFFNSALSASNVTAIYNSGVPADLTSLSPVGWWRMGENDGGTGTTITNQGSASSIDGTLTNGPTFSTTVPS